jgi:hypothetical protein
LKAVLQRNREEFDSDGLRILRGEELKSVTFIVKVANKARSLTIWNPRSTIRLGFLLRDSKVAAKVRTVALNVLQGVGQILDKNVLDNLIDANPTCSHMYTKGRIKVSAPLSNHYYSIEKKIKKMYPTGAIPGLSKKDIRERLAALSTCTKSWKCDTQAELSYKLNRDQQKYPDLVIPGVTFKVDGELKKAVFMIHLVDFLVGVDDVESLGE